ncbi:RNA-binding (RRM/RBD/RNP motifs) family protein [Striga hermonthica]|uniref:RNA-binding (RRM/RBD/RNP motifs) family protein n=1 Tax=Striga hermonthica TaxID=68872 RepID=A0A9N7RAT8_STRHE|nr:RNA-binding (RRM/RBD/RNP motifs) family protein [Striga hermonthica]
MSLPSEQHSMSPQENVAKGTEVFVCGLRHCYSEDKLRELFSTCGEIVEIRTTRFKKGNLKGFCFVRFTTKESAARAVRELSGTVMEGKKIAVRLSSEQDTLYLGNLNKAWSAEEFERMVLEVFPGIETIELPMLKGTLPGQKQVNRGFAFVKFISHPAARRAHRVCSQPDFRLGNLHPDVQWAEKENEIDPNEHDKIKVAFVRYLPVNAEEYYLKQLFEPYGKIEKVAVLKNGSSAVGFVHFIERSDLERAIKELNEKTVQGPSGGPVYKLQVEIARPMDNNKKRGLDNSESNFVQDHPKHSKPDIHCSLVQREIEPADPYEEAVIALPLPVKERLLRILRLGIATRFDIDVRSLCSLSEIPEPNAISVLDQFMLSGASLPNKGEYLDGLISKYLVEKSRSNQRLDIFSRVAENTISGSSLFRISHHVSPRSTEARPDIYATSYSLPHSGLPLLNQAPTRHADKQSFSNYPSPSRTPTGRESDRSPLSKTHTHSLEERSLYPYELRQVPKEPGLNLVRPQIMFDPFTGEPYKFDPFTGEPIRPENTESRRIF